ncbi:hypothetical protein [Paenibacillus sp. P32E]|uniref:hypothetical protein n=1 Tax=Paenibacillus sp. P32E TaxID=1349434 RepID=UPI000939F0F2|nr:hypothetical protein [Paenibacillus sp. P32E]OKP89743.1 hypothetical protein A3848_13195 [Paenibacillus sp. P32E]
MSIKRKLNRGWHFAKQPLGSELANVLADADWMPVTLPHDWLIYNTHALYEDGEGKFLEFSSVICEGLVNNTLLNDWKV